MNQELTWAVLQGSGCDPLTVASAQAFAADGGECSIAAPHDPEVGQEAGSTSDGYGDTVLSMEVVEYYIGKQQLLLLYHRVDRNLRASLLPLRRGRRGKREGRAESTSQGPCLMPLVHDGMGVTMSLFSCL